jgi:hypothetical protein
VWGSDFTTKAAALYGEVSEGLVLNLFVVVFGSVFPARMVQEVVRVVQGEFDFSEGQIFILRAKKNYPIQNSSAVAMVAGQRAGAEATFLKRDETQGHCLRRVL